MSSIKAKTIYELKDCTIIGVEPGNVNKVAEDDTVVAFTVRADETGTNKRYKILTKGKLAYNVFNLFLASGNTVTKSVGEDITINKVVTVSMLATEREDRRSEIVLENPTQIEFNFNYKIV